MNLEQLKKKTENNRKALDKVLRCYDSIAQMIDESLRKLKEEISSPEVRQKLLEKLNEIDTSIEEFEAQITDEFENEKFHISCNLPLDAIIMYYYGDISFLANTLSGETDIDIPLNIHSSRDLYHLLLQLPDNLVLRILDRICSENDSFMVLDAYQRKDEKSFVHAFECLKSKSNIIKEFVILAQTCNLLTLSKEILPMESPSIDDLEATAGYIQEIAISSQSLPNLQALNNAFNLIENGYDKQLLKSQYKQTILDYLEIESKLDKFASERAKKILENPKYYEVTKDLLAECEKEKNKSATKSIGPIAFPDSILIDKSKRSAFLDKLFDKLEPKYIEVNQREHFIFLLGGNTDRPKDLARINWKENKNTLQAFCRAYLGISENVPWTKLNPIFTVKNEEPKLANSSSKKAPQSFFEKAIKEAIDNVNQ